MKKVKAFCYPIVLLIFLPECVAGTIATTKDMVSRYGSSSVTLSFSTFHTLNEDGDQYWGGVKGAIQTVRKMKVKIGANLLIVPRSCYSDLAEVNRLKLTRIKKNLYKIFLEGGDASTGYSASIIVNDEDVLSRSVHAGEFPDKFYETTYYVDKEIKDD